jgi:hypothetical protein
MKSAMVIEDTGILAQMLRTVIRGINVLARNTRLDVLANGDAAILAIAPFMTRPGLTHGPVAELTGAVRTLRGAFHLTADEKKLAG